MLKLKLFESCIYLYIEYCEMVQLVARRAHNPKVKGPNPFLATKKNNKNDTI